MQESKLVSAYALARIEKMRSWWRSETGLVPASQGPTREISPKSTRAMSMRGAVLEWSPTPAATVFPLDARGRHVLYI
jgi:hypothetical protein